MEDTINKILDLYFQGYKLLDILHDVKNKSERLMQQ